MSIKSPRTAALRRFFVRLALAGTAALLGTGVFAQAPATPVPAERFFQHPAVLDAKLSPSGRRIALTTSRGGTRVGLVVIELEPTPAARNIASFADADVVHFDWVSDDRLAFRLGDLESGSAEDYRRAPGLYAVDADGSRFVHLVRRSGTPFIADGTRRIDALDWNHMLLSVPLQQDGVRPNEVVIGRMTFKDKALAAMEPMWLNTRTGGTRSMNLAGAPARAVHWWFDSKGEPRAALTRSEGRGAVYWRSPADGRWTRLSEFDALNAPFSPVAVEDDGTLYVTHPVGAQQYGVLSRFDAEARAPAKEPLVSAPGFDFDGALILDRPGGKLLGVRVHADAETTVWFDETMKRMQAAADQRLPGRVNRITCSRCGEPGMVALVRSYSDQDPGRLLLYEAADQRWRALSNVLDNIDPHGMATVDFQRIKARDGQDLPVWLTLPAKQPAPAVVLVHGGPWVRGGYWRWEPMAQFLASRGYLVISPEFRGSAGYGEAHLRAGFKQWGQAMQDDVADALLWAQARGLADKRACIAGASYGGYATLMGLVRHPELYRCGVAWVAVTDPFLFLQGSWWITDDISGEGRRYLLPQLVGDPQADAAMLTSVSPLAQAQRIRAPLLLAFGKKDRRVPLAHGERLRDALEQAGRPPEWVSYPDEAHGWRQVSTQVDFARRMEDFLQRHLGDR